MLNAISDNDALRSPSKGSIQGLNLKEFFLLLSSTGLAYRRCELVRVNGTEMDISFLRGKPSKRRSARRRRAGQGSIAGRLAAARIARGTWPPIRPRNGSSPHELGRRSGTVRR